jgi:hypothetical protein
MTCISCAYWTYSHSGDRHQVCKYLSDPDKEMVVIAPIPDVVLTEADFGCNQWEPR